MHVCISVGTCVHFKYHHGELRHVDILLPAGLVVLDRDLLGGPELVGVPSFFGEATGHHLPTHS